MLEIGTQLGPYQILSPVGSGGMGIVYLAEDTRLGRQVAIKILPLEFTESIERVHRFEQEARAVSALNHPNIVTLHDLGQFDSCRYIVMEWVQGRTLRQLIGAPCSLDQVIAIARQIAKALAVTHAAGITHRDIKPENVMLRDDGYVKVLDFGIARLSPATPGQSAMTLYGTNPGVLVGTYAYMSPEQARGEIVGPPSDIFSLGLVLYELLTGQHPFEAESPRARLDAIISQAAFSPARLNPEMPTSLTELLLLMLEKDAELRPTALEIDAALKPLEQPAEVTGRLPKAAHTARELQSPQTATRLLVGRAEERRILQESFTVMTGGKGSLLCVSGEPGIGKTSLVEEFLSELSISTPCLIARGKCSERLAGTEAYLPLLEALDSLLRSESAPAPARVLKLIAPTWYAQLAPISTEDTEAARLLSEVRAATQERLKRELGNFLQELSRLRPLVLFLNDLHWADASTIDILSYLATRFDALRVLLVATFRPSDLLLAKHPFLAVKQELEMHGHCRELRLEVLSSGEIDQYLAQEFPGHQFPVALRDLIHQKTEGNPLFLSDLLRDLRDRGVLAQAQNGQEVATPHWTLTQSLHELADELPTSVRSLIERKIDRLSEEDRQLLLVASVQGYEFDSALVANVLALDSAEVEERLASLERVHHFVRLVKEGEFPDGTLTQRYRFMHGLYQNVLYASLQPTRRAQLSESVAETLERFYGERQEVIASELAALWDGARAYERAAQCYLRAAQNASWVIAHTEAVTLATRGLAALEKLPETPKRAQQEIPLRLRLGLSLAGERGWAAPEVEDAFRRARELSETTGETLPLSTSVRGLCVHHLLRADLAQARAQGERFLQLAQTSQDETSLLAAHNALGMTHWAAGQPLTAQENFERALHLYSADEHRRLMAMSNEDLGVLSRRMSGICLWSMGHPDRALSEAYEAVNLAQQLRHPFSQGGAHYAAAHLHLFRREWQACEEHAETVIQLAQEYDLGDNLTYATIARDAARAYQGNPVEGITQMRQSIAAYQAKGANLMMTCYLGLVADLHGLEWQIAEGLRVVDEALALAARTGERWWEAELHRTRGKLLIKEALAAQSALPSLAEQTPLGALDPALLAEAESCFLRARDVAQEQNAKALELRAVTSLGRFWALQGKRAEARAAVQPVFAWFREGTRTADWQDAQALLSELE